MEVTGSIFTLERPAFVAVLGVFGLCIGSFLNVLVHRLPRMLERQWQGECQLLLGLPTAAPQARYDLLLPHSHCPHCKQPIAFYDNIPVLSWCLLGGRCRRCEAPISRRYPLVELATAMLCAFCGWHFGVGWQAAGACVLSVGLLALALIDLDTQLLPDTLTQPLLWLGLMVNAGGLFVLLPSALAGAVAGYLCLWSVYWIFRGLTGKEGMGQGDFKLLALLGAWLGWKALPLILFGASLVGAIVGIALMVLTGRGRHEPLPFGPFLAAAGWLALVWGEPLTRAWLGLLGEGV